ncbi:Nucleoside diphosphate kinase 6 [Armadillidium vulgare]|nr:Nucleoside diphosphate kinase 6 [Armadillidium vulgare]
MMNHVRKTVQLTLGIIKPDASLTPHAVQVLKSVIDRENLRIVAHKITYLNTEEAKKFYNEHKNRFFYDRLVSFISSGPTSRFHYGSRKCDFEMEAVNGSQQKSSEHHIESPNSIRGNIGLTDTRNSTHGSDSVENAMQEIKFFFPEFTLKEWEEKGRPVTTFEGIT